MEHAFASMEWADMMLGQRDVKYPAMNAETFNDWSMEGGYQSQILSPPDFLSMPHMEEPAAKTMGYDNPFQNVPMLYSQQKQQPIMKKEAPVPSPPRAPTPIDEEEKSDDSSDSGSSVPARPVRNAKRPRPRTIESFGNSRKKSHPEAQRRKRSEMGERFHSLKLLVVPDGDKAPAIGRGNRSTNSKEAILRMAGQKVKALKKQMQELETRTRARSARQQRAAASVPASQVDFAAAYHNSSIGRVTFSSDGTLLDFNEAFATMVDLTRDDMTSLCRSGETIFSLLHADYLPQLFNSITTLLTHRSNMIPLFGVRTAPTPLSRQAQLHLMMWVAVPHNGSAPAKFECLALPAGWVTAPAVQSPLPSRMDYLASPL